MGCSIYGMFNTLDLSDIVFLDILCPGRTVELYFSIPQNPQNCLSRPSRTVHCIFRSKITWQKNLVKNLAQNQGSGI